MSSRGRRIALALIGAASLVASGTAVSDAATSHWHISLQLRPGANVQSVELNSVSAASSNDIWAVGGRNIQATQGLTGQQLIEHRSAGGWQRLPGPAVPKGAQDPQIWYVAPPVAGHVWVLGTALVGPNADDIDYVADWDGSRWRTHVLGSYWTAVHLAVLAPDDVWVLGWTETAGAQHGRYAQWTGARWRSGSLPAVPAGEQEGTVSPSWAPANDPTTRKPELLHLSGRGWHVVRGPQVALPKGARSYYYNDVLDFGHGNVSVTVGYGGDESLAPGLSLFRATGHTWRRVLWLPNDAPAGMSSDGQHGLWLLSAGLRPEDSLLHVVGGKVTARVAPPASAGDHLQIAQFVLVPGTRTLVAVGMFETTQVAAVATYTP